MVGRTEFAKGEMSLTFHRTEKCWARNLEEREGQKENYKKCSSFVDANLLSVHSKYYCANNCGILYALLLSISIDLYFIDRWQFDSFQMWTSDKIELKAEYVHFVSVCVCVIQISVNFIYIQFIFWLNDNCTSLSSRPLSTFSFVFYWFCLNCLYEWSALQKKLRQNDEIPY